MTTDGPTPSKPDDARNEEFWRDYLSHPDSMQTFGRHVFSRIPSSPRCQLCASPFGGVGGPLMRLIGKRQALGNPNMCNTCQKVLIKYHGGAEVEGSLLFADIRGSTSMAEKMSAGEFRDLLDRFYTKAGDTVFAHNGDRRQVRRRRAGGVLSADLRPAACGDRCGMRARPDASHGACGPRRSLGPDRGGVHTGRFWFGAVGEGNHVEITVLGDAVNTTARLAAEATTGEIIVSADAAAAAGLDPTLERRSLALKGKESATEVVSLRVEPER